MATYVNHTLKDDEQIIYVAHLHWIIYAKAAGMLAASGAVLLLSYLTPIGVNRISLIVASALAFMALRYAVIAWWHQYTIEMVVTDRRVIYKTGFIWRHTAEMFLPRIESVFVDQSVLGRLLDFGTIHCRGTGQGIEHLHRVANPLAVQHAINGA